MEFESNPRKRGKAMGASSAEEEDRLSGLPEDVLHSILGVLPLKHAVRTSALSTKWAHRWLHALAAYAVLDFTDLRGKSAAQIAATVDRVLAIHGAAPIDVFRVALSPFDVDVVVRWVAAAMGRGAREVGVDLAPRGVLLDDATSLLQLPGDLFRVGNSLSVLSLGRCSLRDVPPGTPGLAGLTSLSLDRVDVTDDAVRDVVSQCRLLQSLSLTSCHLLVSVRVSGEKLRILEIVGCLAMRDLRVAAPALESFAYHGDILYYRYDDNEADSPMPVEFFGKGDSMTTSTYFQGKTTTSTPELRDAYLSHLGFGGYDELIHEFAYSCFLENLAHARILALCSVGLLHIQEECNIFELSMATPNLEELQLLMDSMGDDDVTHFAGFFGLTEPPLLERLFIRLPPTCDDSHGATEDVDNGAVATKDGDIVLYFEIALDHLTFIKVVNFHGTTRELRLLRFLLRRAPVLEQLVLVIPEEEGTPGDHDQQQSVSLLLKIVQENVSEVRKAWLWQDPHVTVCRPREDDSRGPAHTKYYHDKQARFT